MSKGHTAESAPNNLPLNWQIALSTILSHCSQETPQSKPLTEAFGLTPAADVQSPIAVPPFDNSAMDGFAVIASDTAMASLNTPVTLKVIGQAPAGTPFCESLKSGETVEIMTGAVVPDGADAIVRVESTERTLQDEVIIKEAVSAGTHVRRAGADTAVGDLLIQAGELITPARAGLLASCGVSSLSVYPRPTITIAVTGDETTQPAEGVELRPGRIFESNSFTLSALLAENNFSSNVLDTMPDDPVRMTPLLDSLLSENRVLITTGGVSMGRYDYMRTCLREIGCEEIFWRVNQQPGGPMLFARRGNSLLFGLPGNPVSAFVCCDLYVIPALLRMAGMPHAHRALNVRLEGELTKGHGKTAFIRGQLFSPDGEGGGTRTDGSGTSKDELWVRSTGRQDSNLLRSLVGRDGYILFPEESRKLEHGTTVSFILKSPEALARLQCRELKLP